MKPWAHKSMLVSFFTDKVQTFVVDPIHVRTAENKDIAKVMLGRGFKEAPKKGNMIIMATNDPATEVAGGSVSMGYFRFLVMLNNYTKEKDHVYSGKRNDLKTMFMSPMR